MITVCIQTDNNGAALSRSLLPLVEGAMEGVVSTVKVFSQSAVTNPEIDFICDHSGADYLRDISLTEAIANSKDDWILLLEAGAHLEGDWLSGVINHINSTTKLGRFALVALDDPRPWWQRLFANSQAKSALRQGCLMPKNVAINAAKSAHTIEAMARGRAMITIRGGRISAAY